MIAHKSEVFMQNIQRFDADERGPQDHTRSFREDAKKAKLDFCEGNGQEIKRPQETPSGIGFLGSPLPRPREWTETRDRQAAFLRGKRPGNKKTTEDPE